MNRKILLEWPELSLSAAAELADDRNKELCDDLWNALPVHSIMNNAVITDGSMYCWLPILSFAPVHYKERIDKAPIGRLRYSQATGNKLIVQYSECFEDVKGAVLGTVVPEDIDTIRQIGQKAREAIFMSKEELHVRISRLGEGNGETAKPEAAAELRGMTEPWNPAESQGMTEPWNPAESQGMTEPWNPAESQGMTEPWNPAEPRGMTEPWNPAKPKTLRSMDKSLKAMVEWPERLSGDVEALAERILEKALEAAREEPEENRAARLGKVSGVGSCGQYFSTWEFVYSLSRDLSMYTLYPIAHMCRATDLTVRQLEQVYMETEPGYTGVLGSYGLRTLRGFSEEIHALIASRTLTRDEFRVLVDAFTLYTNQTAAWAYFYFPWGIGTACFRFSEENRKYSADQEKNQGRKTRENR